MPANPPSPEGPSSPPSQPTPATPPAEPKASRKAPPPLFKPPSQPGAPADPPPTRPVPPPATPAAAPPGADSAAGSPIDEIGRGRKQRSASPGRPTNPLAFVEPIEAGVLGVSVLANELLSRDELERDTGVYLAEPEDAHGIAVPASRLLSRRMREDGVLNPDLADAIAALVALAGYVSKVFRRRAQLRAERAAAAPAHEPAKEAA